MFSIKNLFFILTLSFFWTEPFKLEAQSIPTKGLILWVPFNGNLSDESINRNKVNLIDNNSGTIINEVNLLCPDRFGNASNAINFNGKAENNGIKISLTEPLVLDDRTISFWMKSPVKLSTLYGNLFEIGFNKKVRQNGSILGNEPSYILQKRVGKISCLIPEGGYIESKSYLNDENWHHFVFVVNTNEKSYKIFIDGQFDSDSYLQVPVVNNSNPYSSSLRNEVSTIFVDYFIFGNILRNNNECAFDGFIDDIGVWNRALNNSEISQLYNNFYKPESRPIVKTDDRIKDALPSSVLFKNNTESTQIYRNENIPSSSNSICEINSSRLQQIKIFSDDPVVRYFGECKNGFPNGYGKALLKSGAEMYGIFNSSSLVEGPIKYVESTRPSIIFANWTNAGFDGYSTTIFDTTRFTASSVVYKSNQWKISASGGIDTSIITKLNELNFDLENNAILDYGTSNSLRIPNSNFYLITNKHRTPSGTTKTWYSLIDMKSNTKIADIGSISSGVEFICYSADFKFMYFKQQNVFYKASVQTGKLILCDKLESQTITSLFKNLNNNEEYGKGYTMYGSSIFHFTLDRFVQRKNYYTKDIHQPVDSSKLFIYSISGSLKKIEYIKKEIVSTYISSNGNRIYVLLNSYDSLFVSSYDLSDLSFEKNILILGYPKNKLPNLGGGLFQLGASLCVSSNEKYICINESIFKNNSIFYAIPGFIGFSNDESTAFSSNYGVFSAYDLSTPKLRWYLDYARTYNRLVGDKKKMIIENSTSPRFDIIYNLNDNELRLFCSDKEFKSAHLVINNIKYRQKPDNDLSIKITSQVQANSNENLNLSSDCKSILQQLSSSSDKIFEIARKGKNNLLNFDAIAFEDERLKFSKLYEKIKPCISKFNSSEKQEYSQIASKLKESIRLFNEIMLIVKSVNSTPYTSDSQTSSRSTERRWNYICRDCNKVKVLESEPYDTSPCPETRWGGVGKASFAEGKHSYLKTAKYGSIPYACSTCGISISTDGKILSEGPCAATGNSREHKWQK